MTTTFQISDNFNIDELIGFIAQQYQLKGYKVVPVSMGDSSCIEISSGQDGFLKYLGLSLCVRVNIIKKGNMLTVSYTHRDWLFKILAIAVGFVLSIGFIGIILAATGVFGLIKQVNFPNEIAYDVNAFLTNSASI